MSNKLFRTPPPREFVEEILQHLKLQGLHERRWFSRDELSLATLDEWLPLLEPYYIPCKAKRFLSDMTPARVVTILRHILHPLDYDLRTQERMYKLHKTTMYQIVNRVGEITHDLSGTELRVDFN